MKQILVVAEIFAGQIRPITWELAAAARLIEKILPSQQSSPAIHVIVPAEDPGPLAETIAQQTGLDVIGLQVPELKAYSSEIYISCLEQLTEELKPSHILVAHTPQGQDFAPGLAVGINAASVPAVNGIRCDEEGLVYSRPVFDNSRNLLVRPTDDRPVVLTVMPGVFKPAVGNEGKSGRVDIREVPCRSAGSGDERIRHRRFLKTSCDNQALKEAKVIVAAGRGIKEKENLKSIFEFAQSFSSSAVGASRPLIDMKWIEYQHQVGITGATVSPRLYIACGISGSTQHLAGMKRAEFVVAINKNPEAPIFLHADLCITEDVLEFIDAFLTTRGESNGFCDFK